ncbi:unnamed protein product, partial [Meganyctiphanes norvegica]
VPLTLHFRYSGADVLKFLSEGGKLHLDMEVKSSSEDIHPGDNTLLLPFDVHADSQLIITSYSLPEMAPVVNKTWDWAQLHHAENNKIGVPTQALGPHIQHKTTLVNKGPATIYNAQVTLEVPLTLEGFPLLYVVEAITTQGPVSCIGPTINPLNLTVLQDWKPETTHNTLATTMKKRKREVRFTERPHKIRRSGTVDDDTSSSSVAASAAAVAASEPAALVSAKRIDCSIPEYCQQISCEVNLLEPGETATLSLASYVVAATLQKFSWRDGKQFTIASTATAKVDQPGGRVNIVGNQATAFTFVTFSGQQESLGIHQVAWWVYLLAVIVGAMIIVIIMVILTKAGFFVRHRPPGVSANDTVSTPGASNSTQ